MFINKIIIYLFSALIFLSCAQNREKQSSTQNINKVNKDSLFLQIIKYVAKKPEGISNEMRFENKHNRYYNNEALKFELISLEKKDLDSSYYFFLSRPVGGTSLRRGVVGKFKYDTLLQKISHFEEVINTPHLKEEVVLERGRFLYKELLKSGDISKYITMKQFVEWPDSNLYYDKSSSEWKNR
jgi:hypothetical protein